MRAAARRDDGGTATEPTRVSVPSELAGASNLAA